jgi:4-amino-4-deoxy-L-arabinose transferase-like glycosyltransferase
MSAVVGPGHAAWHKPALVAAGVLSGVALRIVVLRSNLGALDSDEAVVGLMALHALHGEFSVFFWLQAYTGFQAPILLAPVLLVTGANALVLKIFTVVLYAVATILVWRVGRYTVGNEAAVVGALIFWTWPPFFVWWTTRSYLYEQFLILGLLALLLALRLRVRLTRRDAALLGVVLGLGWWASPQVFLLALPAVVWLVARRPAVLRLSHFVIVPALVTSAPWFVWNARNNWLSLRLRPEEGAASSFAERLNTLFVDVIPTWLALRTPLSLEWTLGPAVGVTLLVVALGYVAWLFYRRPPELEPLLVVLAFFPIFYLTSSFAYYAAAPKYLVMLAPIPALLIARVCHGRVPATIVVTLAVVVSFFGIREIEATGLYAARVPNVRVPKDISPLIDTLEREQVNRVFADYWLAYRITFETDERIIATSTGFVRYLPHDRLVRSSRNPAYAFVRGSTAEAGRRPELTSRGYRRVVADGFVVYVKGR